MPDRNHPSVAFWITVALVVVLVGYPLSMGPACWVTCWCDLPADWLFVAYAPFIWKLKGGHDLPCRAIWWYSLIGAPDGCGWVFSETGDRVTDFGRLF